MFTWVYKVLPLKHLQSIAGIKVFGISVITDLGGFDVPVEVSHEEVQEAANMAQPHMTEIMREMIKRS